MKNTTITKLEMILLKDIVEESLFNGDVCDLNKSWEENIENFEDENMFQTFVEAGERAEFLNMDVKTVKGVLGSLVKKGFIAIYYETINFNQKVDWLYINVDHFNNIKKAMKNC